MPIIEGEFRRILVRATNWVGDAVMSLPASRPCASDSPHPTLPSCAALGRRYLRPRDVRGRSDPLQIAARMERSGRKMEDCPRAARRADFDIAILLPNAFEAAALAWMAAFRSESVTRAMGGDFC